MHRLSQKISTFVLQITHTFNMGIICHMYSVQAIFKLDPCTLQHDTINCCNSTLNPLPACETSAQSSRTRIRRHNALSGLSRSRIHWSKDVSEQRITKTPPPPRPSLRACTNSLRRLKCFEQERCRAEVHKPCTAHSVR
jgi:hypothetical protein